MEYDYNSLVIGSTTPMTGCFFTDMWGNGTSDADVRRLLHGCSLVKWVNDSGSYTIDDRVVSGLVVTEDEEKNRTYLIALKEGLFFSDGEAITSRDYVFSVLLTLSPVLREIGGQNGTDLYIVGSDEYSCGETNALKGVSIINDTMFSITVKAEVYPYYYEMSLLDILPYPMHVIAPGCYIAQTENGMEITGDFTAGLLRKTILDEETGYLSHPSVVSGPYTLVSFDGVTAEFELNTFYMGDAEGVLPHIQHLTYTLADNTDMVDKLAEGSFGLLNKAVVADTISQGIALSGDEYSMKNYMRTGLSMLHFCCEKAAVSGKAVRQAIAYCFDRDQLVNDVVGYYGMRTDGYYGLGQWTYQIVSGGASPAVEEPAENASASEIAEYEEQIGAFGALSLENVETYSFDPDKAVELLISDGWILNEQGESFTQGVDSVRCKEIDGKLVALDLTLALIDGSAATDSLQTTLVEPLSDIGVRVTIVPKSGSDLMKMYYRETERDCDMIYMATNFATVYDPTGYVDPADAAAGYTNRTAVTDEELYQLAVELRSTEPGDVLSYCEKWIAFQEKYMEVLPSIPVYTDVYFDFYTSHLYNYQVNQNVAWSEAILTAYMDDIDEAFGPDEDEEAVEGEIIFDGEDF